MVKNTKYGDEISEEKEVSQDYEMKKKRLQLMFGDPNLTIEDIVTPIGEKELEEEVKRLKEEKEQLMIKDGKNVGIEELEKEVKKSKEEYEVVMKEMQKMRQQQVGGIEEACENMKTMCLDVAGYVKKVEQNIKDIGEERDRAQESQKKLKEELQIAKNEEARSRSSMMGRGEP